MLNRKRRGFTLIEVLIALVILAIALTAIIKVITDAVKNTNHLKTSMAAHWVAENTLAKLQVGLIKLSDAPIAGNSFMFQHHYWWQVKPVKQGKANPVYQQVKVLVRYNQHAENVSATLSGFVRSTYVQKAAS